MKILWLSKEGNGLDLALRLQLEGAEVQVWTQDQELQNLEGFLTRVPDWRPEVPWADLVVLDDTGMPGPARELRASGKPVFGIGHSPSEFKLGKESFHGYDVQEFLETKRQGVHELLKSLQIGLPIEALHFTDKEQALKHLREHQVRHAVKPEVQGSGSEKTYVGRFPDNEDAIQWLDTLEQRPNAGKIKSLELEEVKTGVEVGIAAWFNGHDFVYPVNLNWEHKKLATGDLGFNTGEMGTVMIYDHRDPGAIRLFRETLLKLGDFLRQVDFRGQLDINCIVNEEGIWPLELTPRLGYPSSYIEPELQITRYQDLLYAIASGSKVQNLVKDTWAMGVVLVGEGYPFWDEGHKRMDLMPVIGLNRENLQHLHPYDVRVHEGRLVATGCYPLTATGEAQTVREVQDQVYRKVIPQVFFPGMYYRTDIGDKMTQNIQKLQRWGYQLPRSQ